MHERISIHSICFPSAGLTDLADHWRELGASRVSLSSPQLLSNEFAALDDVLRSGGHRLETITHPFLGARPLDSGESSWGEPRATLARVIEAATRLGARSIYMLTGGHGSGTWEQSAESFAAAIAPCVVQAESAGVALLIENASPLYADLHIAHSLRDTITLAEMAGIGLCIDVYGCWTEAGLRASIERALPRCHVIQLSDYVLGDRSLPSRAVPGDGAIPLPRILEWVLDAGYGGVFDLELPGPRIEKEGQVAAVRRAAQRIEQMLRTLGA